MTDHEDIPLVDRITLMIDLMGRRSGQDDDQLCKILMAMEEHFPVMPAVLDIKRERWIVIAVQMFHLQGRNVCFHRTPPFLAEM